MKIRHLLLPLVFVFLAACSKPPQAVQIVNHLGFKAELAPEPLP